MKVLLVHNFYQSSAPSGEDGVFRNEVELLRGRGHAVVTYTRRNDEIGAGVGPLAAARSTIRSERSCRELREVLRRERPEVAHFHNVWYLISPAAYAVCREEGVPVVQTVHNFRAFCVNGLLMRQGAVCEDCLGKVPWRGVVRGCFRGSALHSLPVALSEWLHGRRGTWDMVSVYVALTDFGRERLVRGGLSAGKITVKPNFLPDGAGPEQGPGDHALFLGRLSPEKGAATLVDAACRLAGRGVPVVIAGDGPERAALEERVRRGGAEGRVRFAGRVPHDEAMRLLGAARFLVIPSLCYEMFPLAVVEAFAAGKPVVASRLGALAELVTDGETGLLFEPGSGSDLAAKMERLAGDDALCAAMGARARARFEARYRADRNHDLLMEIYRRAMSR